MPQWAVITDLVEDHADRRLLITAQRLEERNGSLVFTNRAEEIVFAAGAGKWDAVYLRSDDRTRQSLSAVLRHADPGDREEASHFHAVYRRGTGE
jgi:hypothetical protein